MSNNTVHAATRRLQIEALRPRHAARLFAVLSDARLYAYVDEPPPTSPAALARRYVELERGALPASGETWLNWAIRLRRRRQFVGTLQATVYGGQRAAIAYMIAPPHWRAGYATEAVRWLLRHLSATMSLAEFRASVDIRNEASWRLLERLQFIRVGTKAAELHGRPSTDYCYRLVSASDRVRCDDRAKASDARDSFPAFPDHGS